MASMGMTVGAWKAALATYPDERVVVLQNTPDGYHLENGTTPYVTIVPNPTGAAEAGAGGAMAPEAEVASGPAPKK